MKKIFALIAAAMISFGAMAQAPVNSQSEPVKTSCCKAKEGKCCKKDAAQEGKCCKKDASQEGKCCKKDASQEGKCCKKDAAKEGKCCKKDAKAGKCCKGDAAKAEKKSCCKK